MKIRPKIQIPNIQEAFSKKRFLPVLTENQDTTEFTTPVIKRFTDKKDLRKLAIVFYDSIVDSLEGKVTNPIKLLQKKIGQQFNAFLFSKSANPLVITEGIKSGKKILGGYSLIINPTEKYGYIGFLTLERNQKNTKSSVEFLINLARRIEANAKINGMETIKWTTNKRNPQAIALFERFNATKRNLAFGEIEYSIGVKDFSKALDKYFYPKHYEM